MNSNIIKLKVTTVIGTGDAFDPIMLIPLIHDWGVPEGCIYTIKEKCNGIISRLYRLEEKVQGHGVVGICEKHHKEFNKKTK